MAAACSAPEPERPTIGHVEAVLPEMADLVPEGARVEVLAEGFGWSEGPLWLGGEAGLVFSDTRTNIVHSYSGGDSAGVWLTPSGYTGAVPRGGGLGSNGLTTNDAGQLILAQHGDRRIARMAAPVTDPEPEFETIVDNWQGLRLNSPNDLVFGPDHALYFTDPPYGLVHPDSAEIGFSGVYRLSASGELTLIDSTLTRPNGIAVSPDGSTLYVANSDPERSIWMAYDLGADGSVAGGRLFYDATDLVGPDAPGLPDGLKLDTDGRIWATGPGGVFVFRPDGTHIGTIRTEVQTANVAFGPDGTMYLTSSSYLARISTNVTGQGF